MKYKVYGLFIDINDDVDDLEHFWSHAINNAPIEIFLVDNVRVDNVRNSSGSGSVRGSNQPSTSGSGGFQQQFQQLQPPSQDQQFQPQYYQPPYQQYPQETEPTQLQTHEYNQPPLFPRQSQYQNQQYPHQNTETTEPTQPTTSVGVEHYGEKNVNPQKTYDHPFENDIVSDDEKDEDEKKDESEGGHKKREDIFWNMPPLLQEDLPDSTKRPVTMYEPSSRVKLGQVFESKEELKLQLETKCLEEGFTTKLVKSDKVRYVVICALNNCSWKLTARKIMHSDDFQVRKFVDVHTCSRSQLQANNRHANKRVIGHLLSELMTKEGRVYRGNDIQIDMNARFGISLTYNQAWRAKCLALELLRGTPQESFGRLPIYFHNLKMTNPGSITNVLTDEDDRFVMCFMSIGAAIRSFVNHSRPVIIIDGAHLKGAYLGTNLIAVAMDGNNGILPLAYGVGAGETADHWTWFLGNLRDAIESNGGIENLTIISDRAASIAAGLSMVFPDAFHALCCRHLLMNLKNQSSKVKGYEWHYWKMCKAYRPSDFDHHWRVISRKLPTSSETLTDVGRERWSRCHATRKRYAYMTSNSAESMNALSKHARKLPITMFLEFFRASVQQWYFKHRTTGDSLTSSLTPYADRKVGKRVNKSLRWQVNPVTNRIFEVADGNKNGTVNLDTRTCTCRQWQLSGLPCGHVIAVARRFNQDDVSCYAEQYFMAETYRATYAEPILPMGHPSEWIDPGDLKSVCPPVFPKRQAGRPSGRARIPSRGEEKQSSSRKCSRCKEYGHSRVTCMAIEDRTDHPSQSSTRKSKGNAGTSQSTQCFPSVNLSHP